MSKLTATISRIQTLESLNIVSFTLGDESLKMMSLDLDESVVVGAKVSLNIKPISVAIAKNLIGELSYSNQLNSKIQAINKGELLCSIDLIAAGMIFESIITAESANNMNLQVGDTVSALIKANDVSILEVLS